MEKTYEGFLNIFKHRDIKKLCKDYSINNYTINDDDSIDIYNSFALHVKRTNIPKFRNVGGNFYYSLHTSVLEGCPINVDGNFVCMSNGLRSLNDGPKKVGGDYDCSNNHLTSLIGCASSIGGRLNCSNNNITSFEGFPINFTGSFNCNHNPIFAVWQLFREVTKIELFNDYDIIRDDTIIMDRLIDFLIQISCGYYNQKSKMIVPESILRVINDNNLYDGNNKAFKYKFI